MEKFRYKIELVVEIDAFDSNDAWEAVQDNFGIGDQGGVPKIQSLLLLPRPGRQYRSYLVPPPRRHLSRRRQSLRLILFYIETFPIN